MSPSPPARIRRRLAAATAVLALVAAACGGDDDDDVAGDATSAPTEASTAATSAATTPATEAGTAPGANTEATAPVTTGSEGSTATSGDAAAALEGTVRLGFFPNVTHAPALVGIAEGYFQDALGEGVELETFSFNAGPEASEALFAGAIDMSFIGPNPAINAFAESDGQAIRIISGSTSGGAYLVTTPDIAEAADLVDKTIATPSLGNTQDVALRFWLAEQGYESTPEGGGDVTILPQSNSTTLDAFVAGSIDGAWVPEPWATRLIQEGDGQVLVDERDLWPDTGGEYVTTHLIVNTPFLEEQPDLVKAVIDGLLQSLDAIEADPATAQADVIDQIEEITDQRPGEETIATSFDNLTFTFDPIAASLAGSAEAAEAVGLLDPVDLTGIYDLSLLNELLEERGETPIEAP